MGDKPLYYLHRDCLEQVFGFLDSFSVINLWLCGSSALNTRIVSGGCVKKLNLILTYRYGPAKLPLMLGNLSQLTSLTIVARGRFLGEVPAIWSALKMLANLGHLKMDFLYAEECLMDHTNDEKTGATFFSSAYDDSDSETLQIPDSIPAGEIQPLAEVFPRLKELWLASIERSWIRPEHIASFPKSIHLLYLAGYRRFSDRQIAKFLPEMQFAEVSCTNVKELPEIIPERVKSLFLTISLPKEGEKTSLNAGNDYKELSGELDSFPLLPSSLTEMELYDHGGHNIYKLISSLPESLSQFGMRFPNGMVVDPKLCFPSHLSTLSVWNFPDSAVLNFSLPQTLTSLTLSNSSRELKCSEINFLPRTLLSLTAGISDDELQNAVLPPSLTKLIGLWSVGGPFSETSSVFLPKTLTQVQFTRTLYNTVKYLSELPPNLTSIHSTNNHSTSQLSDEIVEALPKTLTEFSSYPTTPKFDPSLLPNLTSAHFDMKHVNKLSRMQRLQALSIQLRVMSAPEDGPEAPKTWTKIDREFFKLVPRSVKKLSLKMEFGSLAIKIDPDSFSGLHEDLEELYILETLIVGESFRHFPRSLSVLVCNAYRAYDEHVQHLPRTLTRIDLKTNLALTSNCAPWLPRGLKTFSAKSADSVLAEFERLVALARDEGYPNVKNFMHPLLPYEHVHYLESHEDAFAPDQDLWDALPEF